MKVENIKIQEIKMYANNPRKNEKAVGAVAESIKEFGFQVPIVLDRENVIVCGHTRYKAALELDLEELPCIYADDLTDKQIQAFRLVDNKTAEFAGWDFEKLQEELQEIQKSTDMKMFGFIIDEAEEGEVFESDQEFSNDELSLDDFAEEIYKYECPCCGFKWGMK